MKKYIYLSVLLLTLVGCKSKDPLPLLNNIIDLEYGSKVSSKIKDYLNVKEMEDSVKRETIIQFDIINEEGKDYPSIGTYEVTIVYKDITKEVTLNVVDTTAPTIKDYKDKLVIEQNAKDVKITDFITVTDLSEITLENDLIDTSSLGETIVEFTVVDSNKNSITKNITIVVVDIETAKKGEVTKKLDGTTPESEALVKYKLEKEKEEKKKQEESSSVKNNNKTSTNNSSDLYNPNSYDRSNPIVDVALNMLGSPGPCTLVANNAANVVGLSGWQEYTETREDGSSITYSSLSPENFLQLGYEVSINNVIPGDLIYYADGGLGVSHIAVYIGKGMCVHGNFGDGTCKISYMKYSSAKGLRARRIQ